MKTIIKWMADNHVAANILLVLIVLAGTLKGLSIKQEAFPDIEADTVTISVAYDGAGPSEVASQLCRPIEEAVAEVDGVDQITCNANEGVASVSVTLETDTDLQVALQDIRTAVSSISDFPDDAETPVVTKEIRRMELIELVMYGDVPEASLFEYAYRVRDDLLKVEGVNYVKLSGTRPTEILIEIAPEVLVLHNLTLRSVASVIDAESKNYPSGSVKKGSGQILFRTLSEKTKAADFNDISIKQYSDGSVLHLGDIATIRQTLQESDNFNRFNGVPSVILKIYQSNNYTPKELSDKIHSQLKLFSQTLPEELKFEIWRNSADMFESRFNLLIDNALMGLVLVFLILTFFLEIRLAFWVMIGIPVSFLGALFFLPFAGVTINMNSMFAFILVSGIVVDDAIVIGENIYRKREEGQNAIRAAVDGCMEMAGPVIFAILTTICAFAPLLFVEGFMGHFVYAIPVVVVSVITISLLEALLILPAHLAWSSQKPLGGFFRIFVIMQSRCDAMLKWFIFKPFRRIIDLSLKHRYATISLSLAFLLLSFGMIGGGVVPMQFFPKIEDHSITATIELPNGYPTEKSLQFVQAVEASGKRIVEEADQKAGNGLHSMDHMFTSVSSKTRQTRSQNTTIGVELRLQEDETLRNISPSQLAAQWRESIPKSPDILSVEFQSRMMSFGDDVRISLSHYDADQLKKAINSLKEHLSEYAGIKDISDSESEANPELSFTLTAEAKSLGLTPAQVSEQLKAAFQGIDVFSIPRDSEDIDVAILFPEQDRNSINTLEKMQVVNASNQSLPLLNAVTITEGEEPVTIRRVDGERVVEVTAKFEENAKNTDEIMTSIANDYLPVLKSRYPGISIKTRGAQESRTESMNSLLMGFLAALVAIYALLAVFFKSYSQPLIVMIAIPFGIAGAVGGHYLMGHPLSFMSLFGLVGLSGVVVNDSLILISTVNKLIEADMNPVAALVEATTMRFRPIMLTSLTTFVGLMPILLEKSEQSQFLIPTAISLGVGIMFATFITLVMVPALYLVFLDIKGLITPDRYTSPNIIPLKRVV